jgi:nucleotide-binding universal stress UspA family protein
LDPVFVLEDWDEEQTKGSLKLQHKGLTDAGVTTHLRAARGVEATEILAAAKEADLVALTTHGRGGISRWWFGSVAESVVRHCPCPLLLLRSEEH